MDIGKQINDTYYEGYEGEEEIILTSSDTTYHIWGGYFDDIFGNPIFPDSGWFGFTEDYNEAKHGFQTGCIECAIDSLLYLKDLQQYEKCSFQYPESKEVLSLMIKILSEAIDKNDIITVQVC